MGYGLSIVGCCLFTGISLTEGNLGSDRKQIWWLGLNPIPNYCRVLYLLADQCAWNECVSGFQDVDPEVIKCLVQLYLNAIVYFIIGVYLEQVVPSTFGVPRHPLFFLETTIKQNLPRLYIILFTEEGKLAKHVDTTLEGEDIDVRRERSAVNNLMKEDYQYYPLVIKDIQKIYPGIIDNQPKIANKSITFKINKGELFGLLGPNGAGKTTLMQ